jgi:hypothetical protein
MRLALLFLLCCSSCSATDEYYSASELVLATQDLDDGYTLSKRWVYDGPDPDIFPWDRKSKSQEAVDECLSALSSMPRDSLHLSPASKVTRCMANKHWFIEYDRQLIITVT